MFLGDFMQFPLVNGTPLYTINIKPTLAFMKQTLKKLLVRVVGKLCNSRQNYLDIANVTK
jgi:hypothetical protein